MVVDVFKPCPKDTLIVRGPKHSQYEEQDWQMTTHTFDKLLIISGLKEFGLDQVCPNRY
jgi:hypothetical protein